MLSAEWRKIPEKLNSQGRTVLKNPHALLFILAFLEKRWRVLEALSKFSPVIYGDWSDGELSKNFRIKTVGE